MSVDFPDPDLPVIANDVPDSISKLTFFSANLLSYLNETLLKEIVPDWLVLNIGFSEFYRFFRLHRVIDCVDSIGL